MNYLLINASPRGKESNSALLLSVLKEGLLRGGAEDYSIETMTLRPTLGDKSWKGPVDKADLILIAFPLYADLVPGILKQFIEDLGRGGLEGKKIGWISQCGFPDSIQLEVTERYLMKTIERLGANSVGIVKKAGVEGIRIMPPSMTKKLFEHFRCLGEDLVRCGSFDSDHVRDLAHPRMLSFARKVVNNFFGLFGLTNFYWNSKLKENNAYDKRFAQPYKP